MNGWKRFTRGIICSLILIVLLAGCASQADNSKSGQTHRIKVAHYFAANHPQNIALREKFKDMVEKNSKGTLKVDIYENSKLGAEKEFYDGVRNGTIEMGIPGMIMQADIPKMAIPELPFLFKDFKHAKTVLQGPIGKELTSEMESKHGVRVLAWSANGFRMISGNHPITKMSDFKGFRLRMPNIPNYIALGKSWGANVTPLPISEVFTALEQKVVDGQENPIATLRASGWYEVQTHVLESRHMFSPNVYIINKKFWDKLTPEQQKVIEEAAQAAADYEWKLLEQSYQQDKKFLQENGLKFQSPDEQLKKEMETAANPIYEEFYRMNPSTKELIQKIKAAAAN
ncbi:TRAP transporter substrate-binding protein [Lihuaxuella thermophila]|uniref:Tripartite ATP-independent transporter solute receptor, DctP family n=1 Tax=Lihuaxuella thermophila TaxID=1173111 RepID=A0A1H8J7T7_9BACL|nr:TRAP transporter substrate-binding protein [Lihuaxuella thermophila]SEN76671.1 tripartite ATP-independent transporter solute receptor, DctP family [Lihuaxuella thermophila]